MTIISEIERDVVITGHAGFIGKRLHSRLPGARTLDRQVHHLDEPTSLSSVLASARVIFHFAGVNAGSGYNPPNEVLARNNVLATYGLLQGIKRFAALRPLVVLLSSLHVYRKCDRYSESSELTPASYYGLTKLVQELLLQEAAQSKAINALIFRVSNVYGPGCRPNYNSAVATFCYRILTNSPIELWGNGKSQADLIFVDDVVEILLRSLELQKPGCTTYNLSSGKSIPVKEIIELLSRISGRSPVVRLLDTAPLEFTVDNSRLLAALDGFQFTDIETGLLETFRAMKNEVR